MPHAQELVQVILYKKLACVSVNLVQVFSGISFLHALEHSSILGQKLSVT